MSQLRNENFKKCVSLLQEFIDGSNDSDAQKGIAALALNQLQMITAGERKEKNEPTDPVAMMEGGLHCVVTPMADPSPGL